MAERAAVPGPVETEPPQDLPRFVAQHYSQLRADFTSDRWTAPLAALWDSEPAGVQELFGDKYLVAQHQSQPAASRPLSILARRWSAGRQFAGNAQVETAAQARVALRRSPFCT